MLQNTELLFYLNNSQYIERYISLDLGQTDVHVVAANATM